MAVVRGCMVRGLWLCGVMLELVDVWSIECRAACVLCGYVVMWCSVWCNKHNVWLRGCVVSGC